MTHDRTEPLPMADAGEDYCFWESVEEGFKVGLVGCGPGFMTLMSILRSEEYQEFIPPLELVAVSGPLDNERKRRYVETLGGPVYDNWRAMLAAHPEINLLVELTGKRMQIRRIRKELDESVSLVDHNGSVFLCGMHTALISGRHAKLKLDRHKELLQAIIDEVREDILVLDLEGRVVDMNRSVREKTSAEKEELIGRLCWEVQQDNDGNPFCTPSGGEQREECSFHKTLKSVQMAETMTTRVDAEGQLHYYRIYAYPIFSPGGAMTHILVMRRDITSRTVRERRRQQEEKLAMLGELSAYLAHEIRNPLFSIAGFTNSLLKAEDIDAKYKKKLRIIAEEAGKLEDMLNSILSFARTEKAELACVDLGWLVGDTVELMRLGHCGRGVDVQYFPDKGLPRVMAEPEGLKQCLVHVITNSTEAMTEGGLVTVTTGIELDKVYIRIEDVGYGMSEETLEQVFSPFFTTKSGGHAGGHGLGLASIKKKMEEMDGSVDVRSVEGEGTTVTLYLRAVCAAPEEEGPNRARTSADRRQE